MSAAERAAGRALMWRCQGLYADARRRRTGQRRATGAAELWGHTGRMERRNGSDTAVETDSTGRLDGRVQIHPEDNGRD
jgi:hypothetical protein